MTDATTTTANLTQRLEDLKKRLTELDSERVAVRQEIEVVQRLIAAVAPPSPGETNRSQVLWLLRRDPEHAYSPLDVWQMLGRKSEADLNNIRVTLSRLAREGAVKRVGHGRYRIV